MFWSENENFVRRSFGKRHLINYRICLFISEKLDNCRYYGDGTTDKSMEEIQEVLARFSSPDSGKIEEEKTLNIYRKIRALSKRNL